MPRFAVSHHTGSPDGDHYDLLLESGDVLLTWRFPSADLEEQVALRIQDHQRKYLDYEGEISDGRGQVKLWDRGEMIFDFESEGLLAVALRGGKIQTRLHLLRAADSEDHWRTHDVSTKLRRSIAVHLRGADLPLPDPKELVSIYDDLRGWEGRLTPVVDRFVHGRELDWAVIGEDPAITKRVRSLRARWAHPWLVQAYRFAMRLDGWVRHMHAYRSPK